MDTFNNTLRISAIKLTIIMILAVIYALAFPQGNVYLGPTMVLLTGLCLFFLFAVPALHKRLKIMKALKDVSADDINRSLNNNYRLYTIIAKMFSWLGGIMVVIGITFTLLNYYDVF